MIKDYLSIFNTTSSSVLPGSALVVTQSWLALSHTSSLLIAAFLKHAGLVVKDGKIASALLEAGLESYFRDGAEVKPSWNAVKTMVSWPSGNKIKDLLEASVGQGCCLTLYAYLDQKQDSCLDSLEEQGWKFIDCSHCKELC